MKRANRESVVEAGRDNCREEVLFGILVGTEILSGEEEDGGVDDGGGSGGLAVAEALRAITFSLLPPHCVLKCVMCERETVSVCWLAMAAF